VATDLSGLPPGHIELPVVTEAGALGSPPGQIVSLIRFCEYKTKKRSKRLSLAL
jgi:hypothetical protein